MLTYTAQYKHKVNACSVAAPSAARRLQTDQYIENFVNWCDKNYLYLNVSKTKEMSIDFRKNQRCPKPVYVKGEAVERVDTYKHLGVVLDIKLN